MATDQSFCGFCQIARGSLPAHGVYEDESIFVILDRESLGFGHCMVVSRRHAAAVYELDENDYHAVFEIAKKLARRLQRVTAKRAIGYVAFGSGLLHAHLHLVPHDHPDELLSTNAKRLSDDELTAQAAKLRLLLSLDSAPT